MKTLNRSTNHLLYVMIGALALLISFTLFSLSKSQQVLNEATIQNKQNSAELKELRDKISSVIVESTFDQHTASDGLHSQFRTFFIDPVNGLNSNNGTIEHPWQSLSDLIASGMIEYVDSGSYEYNSGENVIMNEGAPIKSGDRIYLLAGHHGSIELKGVNNDIPITIAAYPNNRIQFDEIIYDSWDNWIFENFNDSHHLKINRHK